MRVLLSYATEFDKGEGAHFSRVLTRIGHEVREVNVAARRSQHLPSRSVKGYPADIDVRELLQETGGCDFFLYIEPLGLIPFGLDTCPVPTACVISDVHRNLDARKSLARLFDYVFLYQKHYLTHFSEHPRQAVHWMPYACDTEFFRDLSLPRDLDVAFVGQLFGPQSRRRRVLQRLAQRYRINEQRYYLQSEIPEVYSRAKIILNVPVGDDLNFRFFEALSCGALLLTSRSHNGQDELFSENIHYVAYGDDEELYEKIEFYLRHKEARMEIAATGYQEVVRGHTLALRLQRLIDIMQSNPLIHAPVRQMDRADILRLYAHAYDRAGRVEAILRMALERKAAMRLNLFAIGLRSVLRQAVLSC